jgi:Skp family chaperone for outer membrane proteins
MRKLVFLLSLIAAFSVLATETQESCFLKADKKLFESASKTTPGQSTYEQYVNDLKACQDKFSNIDQEEEYLNEDYNKCMDRVDKKHDRDSARCDKKTNASERTRCQSQADKRHTNSTSSCERVNHSDNGTKIFGK